MPVDDPNLIEVLRNIEQMARTCTEDPLALSTIQKLAASALPDEDRPTWLPPALPIEDHEKGLYIHQPRPEHDVSGTEVLMIRDAPWEEPTYYVKAIDFMLVQKERDDLRRTCAMINAALDEPEAIEKLVRRAGFTEKDGEAMRDLIIQVRAGL